MFLFLILNIVTLLDTLIILLLVWYGLKFFIRFFGPQVVEKAADKIYRDLKAQEESRRQQSAPSGKMTIERNEKKDKIYRRNDGEYVDFEEVKK